MRLSLLARRQLEALPKHKLWFFVLWGNVVRYASPSNYDALIFRNKHHKDGDIKLGTVNGEEVETW